MSLKEQARKHIDSLKTLVNNSEIVTDLVILKDYNFEFNATSGKNRVKVQIFFGKKGLKVILQGDSTTDFYKMMNNLVFEQQSLRLYDWKNTEPEEYIGSDECGKGDFFGPLVIAAVYVNNDTKIKLKKIGVRDSKDLNDYQIKYLAKEIKKIIGENFSIIRINPLKYNEIYERFGNLNKLLNWAHSKALSSLLEKIDCKFVITDKFSNKDLDISSSSKHSNVEFIQETKAEKYAGVAAASIIARDNFLIWFQIQKKNGFNLPKGSSLETEEFARNFLKKIGEEKLNEMAKLHFKTLKKISSK